MIVVDSSAVIEMILNTSLGHLALEHLEFEPDGGVAPEVIDLEVLHALRGLVLGGQLSTPRARLAFEAYLPLRIQRTSHEPFLERIWALRHNFTSYDASYIAVAEIHRIPLLTCDTKLAKGHKAKVILIR